MSEWTKEMVDAHNRRIAEGKSIALKPTGGMDVGQALKVERNAVVRIRQSSKPLMNKLEMEWFNILSSQCVNYPRPRAQGVTFKLANGVKYTPDVFSSAWDDPMGPSRTTCWEVKGKKVWDDAIVKIKVAAHEWPDIRWILVWKDNGDWKEQEILP